jgi:hypothetical protein
MSGTHENVVSLIADHSSVCKFDESQVDRDNYEIVEGNLRELYDLALERAGESIPMNLGSQSSEYRQADHDMQLYARLAMLRDSSV